MTPATHGNLAGVLALLFLGGLLLTQGCSGPKVDVPLVPPAPQVSTGTPPTTPPPTTLPAPATPRQTPVDLSAPPPTALPYPTSLVDPLIGTWYAPSPDDLTFEFRADGTFTESSPNFRTYQGTWRLSDEGETGFYDADILDRWGFRKQAHLLLSSGTLSIKGIGLIHRVR